MEAEPHVGESAELYAIGVLDADERAVVEAHIARCAQCLRRVGEAEETLLALEREAFAQPLAATAKVVSLERRGVAPWWLAVAAAAAFAVGMLTARMTQQHEPATLAMIQSHFSHAQFSGTGPPAKVLYARDRSWYYVIVSGRHRYGVYGIIGGRSVALGVTEPGSNTSELFTRLSRAFERLELRDERAVVETATIR